MSWFRRKKTVAEPDYSMIACASECWDFAQFRRTNLRVFVPADVAVAICRRVADTYRSESLENGDSFYDRSSAVGADSCADAIMAFVRRDKR